MIEESWTNANAYIEVHIDMDAVRRLQVGLLEGYAGHWKMLMFDSSRFHWSPSNGHWLGPTSSRSLRA